MFERRHRRLAFTPAGQTYHQEVAGAFDRLRGATRQVVPGQGIVTISVTPTFASKWLLPRLGNLTRRYPQVDLRIVATESVSRLHQDGIDIAVRQGEPTARGRLEVVRLFKQDVVAVCAPEYLARHGSPAAPKPGDSYVLLHDVHDLWPDFLRETCGTRLIDSEPKLRFNQTTHAIDAALAGQGIALASRFLVAGDLTTNRLIHAIEGSLPGEKDFYLIAQSRSLRSPQANQVRQWLLEQSVRETAE